MRRTMRCFSAEEDKELLLLVALFDHDGVVRWESVLRNMSLTSATAEELQERLQHLTQVDTTMLDDMSPGYVAGTCLERPSLARPVLLHEVADIYIAVDEIFGQMTRADVKQPSGRPHLNVGECAPTGVTAMLRQLQLTQDDCFVDIGSGCGSVLAQVVLETPVKNAIGLEIRPDLAIKSREAMKQAGEKYLRLNQVEVITGDIKALPYDDLEKLCSATVIFCNNLIFMPEDNLGLHDFICSFDAFGELRAILLTQRLCPRCPVHCKDQFCELWEVDSVIKVDTCWTNHPAEVYCYRLKLGFHKSFLSMMEHIQ